MLYFVFDGSFEGLLTAVYEAYYRNDKPCGLLPDRNIQESLIDRYDFIKTDTLKYEKVYQAVQGKISGQALQDIYHTYLSELEGSATWILNYLQLGFKVGKSIHKYLADDRVIRIEETSRKVGYEAHRMLEFVRFRLLDDNLYYAPIKPLYNVIGLIAPHFAERYSCQQWIIHDTGRHSAALFNQLEWVVADFDADSSILSCREDEAYQKLWKQYFKKIAIREKINPGLQKSHMPMRYWQFLTEKQL